MNQQTEVIISTADFDCQKCYEELLLQCSDSGAVVSFVGLVRGKNYLKDNHDAESVLAIELQHYAGMTEKLILKIIAQAKQRWCVQGVKVIHRVGKLKAQEQIVYVGVASLHRKDAFNAAEYIMDYLKTKAPLWKKEIIRLNDGTQKQVWLDGKDKDQRALEKWTISSQ